MDKSRGAIVCLVTLGVCLLAGCNDAKAPPSGRATGRSGAAAADKEEEVRPREEPPKRPALAPVVEVQREDYAEVRARFRTKLSHQGPSPQQEPMPRCPAGVTEVEFASGPLRLKAWVNRPPQDGPARPAVLFVHGGFGFGPPDWDMAQPYRDAGYVVLTPMLRGENGQPGSFSLLYDEVDDVLAAAKYLAKQPYVDAERLYLAGHSSGGGIALLAAMASGQFRAVASFDGLPDMAAVFKPGSEANEVRFDLNDPRELQVRSALAYAASFKCPARLYYSRQAWEHMHLTSRRTAEVAKERGLDVEAHLVEGDHLSMVQPAMKQSIEFFGAKVPEK